ncbi:MAG TPA: hypothetical protein VD769_02770 [Gaiellaceae bacterium]|nr:hypothetical protein [Gaiellaceae bacterium]
MVLSSGSTGLRLLKRRPLAVDHLAMAFRWIEGGLAAFCALVAIDAGRDSEAGLAWWVLAALVGAGGFWWIRHRATRTDGRSERTRWAAWGTLLALASTPLLEGFFEQGQLVLLGGVSGGLVAMAIWVRPRAAV